MTLELVSILEVMDSQLFLWMGPRGRSKLLGQYAGRSLFFIIPSLLGPSWRGGEGVGTFSIGREVSVEASRLGKRGRCQGGIPRWIQGWRAADSIPIKYSSYSVADQ